MTIDEARDLLVTHSFGCDDFDDPTMESGFLGSLRPYRSLHERNFHQVIAALQVLAPELGADKVDSKIMSALWSMCTLARSWGVHPDGMLRGNGLIAEEDVARLESWIDAIGYAVMTLLEGGDTEEAFSEYRHIVAEGKS